MMILTFATVHGLAFDNLHHLIKTMKLAFPDSSIASNLKLSRQKATYGLRHGLAKTELELTVDTLKVTPFSASLDGGTKGNNKRTEVLFRYWSAKEDRVVEQFLHCEKTNHETAEIVSDMLIKVMEDNEISRF